jgi:hypothetical protein
MAGAGLEALNYDLAAVLRAPSFWDAPCFHILIPTHSWIDVVVQRTGENHGTEPSCALSFSGANSESQVMKEIARRPFSAWANSSKSCTLFPKSQNEQSPTQNCVC